MSACDAGVTLFISFFTEFTRIQFFVIMLIISCAILLYAVHALDIIFNQQQLIFF